MKERTYIKKALNKGPVVYQPNPGIVNWRNSYKVRKRLPARNTRKTNDAISFNLYRSAATIQI